MKLSQLSIATLLCVASVGAFAQAKAPEPDYTLSFNAGVVTDYRYRGISQTRYKPAVQGGVDFAHKSGVYLGAWATNIKWIKDYSVSGGVELDLYGGYKGSITKDIGFDVGVLRYEYVGNKLDTALGGGVFANANTTEVYGALSYGPVTAKYSRSVGRLFGSLGSKGAGYFDVTANFDVGNGFTITPHVGYTSVSKNAVAFYGDDLSYTDYSLTVAKDLGNGFSATAAVVGTDASKIFYTSGANAKYLGKTGLVVGVKYSF
jgi:uncharacterized protein (TIGR02001 family)